MDHRVYSLPMKINRHGRAKVLTQQEIQLIFSDGLDNDRDGYARRRSYPEPAPFAQRLVEKGIAPCLPYAYLAPVESANAVPC
ncbi:hypothetical protein [Nostoc sp.]|uniref:hypothetical protein n=1 Tax=Nostoc sp. TaxID=1180 RepID=UPI002FF47D4E